MAAREPLVNNNCSPPGRQGNILKDYFDEKELKFRHLSAEQFADVWLRYDRDGMRCLHFSCLRNLNRNIIGSILYF